MKSEVLTVDKDENIKSNKSTIDMTKGNIKKVILLFALPIFLSSLFQQLYNSVDSLIVSKFIGNNAFSAVTSLNSMIHMINSFFIGLSMGAGVIISKYFGAKNYKDMSRAIHTDVLLGVLIGIVLTAIGVLLLPIMVVNFMDLDVEIVGYAKEYVTYYFAGVMAIVMYNIFNGILNAVGNSRRSLVYLIISSCLNVVLDLLFIGVFKWGVWSAALATTISQFLSAILCFIHLLNKNNIYHVEISQLKIHKDMFGQIIKYGIPTGIQNSVIGLANVMVQKNINSFGNLSTASFGAYAKVEGYVFLPVTSFTMAISTFISQNLGAGHHQRAKDGARFGILSSMILAEVFGIFMVIFCKPLLSIFINTKDAAMAEQILANGTLQTNVESLFFCFLAYSHCVAAVARGAGKAFVPMFVMLGVWCVFRVSYITIMMSFEATHQLKYLYMAYPITWIISSIIYFIYYYKSNWVYSFDKEKKVIE